MGDTMTVRANFESVQLPNFAMHLFSIFTCILQNSRSTCYICFTNLCISQYDTRVQDLSKVSNLATQIYLKSNFHIFFKLQKVMGIRIFSMIQEKLCGSFLDKFYCHITKYEHNIGNSWLCSDMLTGYTVTLPDIWTFCAFNQLFILFKRLEQIWLVSSMWSKLQQCLVNRAEPSSFHILPYPSSIKYENYAQNSWPWVRREHINNFFFAYFFLAFFSCKG